MVVGLIYLERLKEVEPTLVLTSRNIQARDHVWFSRADMADKVRSLFNCSKLLVEAI
jgi:hypothetical protein